MIPLNKLDGYTAEKLYEREDFYLTLKRLRDVINSTIQKADEKELLKCARKLRRYYNMSCKRLDINYNRIARIYGGALFILIERDSTASDTGYSLSGIGSKVDEMISDISSIRNDLDEK